MNRTNLIHCNLCAAFVIFLMIGCVSERTIRKTDVPDIPSLAGRGWDDSVLRFWTDWLDKTEQYNASEMHVYAFVGKYIKQREAGVELSLVSGPTVKKSTVSIVGTMTRRAAIIEIMRQTGVSVDFSQDAGALVIRGTFPPLLF